MGEVVTSVDHQIRLQRRKLGHPTLPGLVPRRHVQVRDVQHSQRRRPGGQDRHLDAT
jgi:hypothetical protein